MKTVLMVLGLAVLVAAFFFTSYVFAVHSSPVSPDQWFVGAWLRGMSIAFAILSMIMALLTVTAALDSDDDDGY